MEIRLGYELGFEVPRPTPMQLMLYVHPEQASRLRQPERIEVEPATAVEDFIDGFGNRAARILAPAGAVRIRYDNVIQDSGHAEAGLTGARLTPVHAMPPDRWRFLLNIPARYATGFLGDIGVPASASPMDFSAWSEVYVDGAWRPLDARHNRPRIGRVLMARGRDAVDVALTTSFGAADLTQFTVWTD